MKEVLIYIAQQLVDSPDEVVVTEVDRDGELVLQLHVAQGDMGKVIGKQGRIAKAIRTLMKSTAVRANVRLSVDIVD